MADTRPFFPKKLHGKQMAIGYSGLGRDKTRKPVDPFFTKGITPAAGFTSTVNDLARFASWNFRTVAGQENDVLDPNTLREMQRVHWVDPDWENSWGLGFVVAKAKKQTVVGHGGGCPGYITSLSMVPKQKVAAITLTNAGDGPANSVNKSMVGIIGAALQKAVSSKQPVATPVDLRKYEGNFGGSIWGGEVAIRQWGDKLSIVRLPSDSLEKIEKLKRVAGDTFVRMTTEDEVREQWVFQTNDKDEVVGFIRHSNMSRKL
jgi:CubicO group peptidase (beta-lactamase class C family)